MMDLLISTDKQYYMNTFGDRLPVSFHHGEGMCLYSDAGDKYYDFFAGIAVSALGHSHPYLVASLKGQISKLLHTSNLYYSEVQAKLAKMLCGISCADKVFIANSGAEANEGAIKLARMYFHKKGQSEKNEIITLKNSFHGRTLATVAATGQEKFQEPYKPLMPGFKHVPLGDMDALLAAVSDKTCAVMLEFIQGESGVHPCDMDYIKAVRELCDKRDIILVADEVQTGVGRTGKMFAYERYGIEPDIFTLAKALGGGVPVGALCAKDKFCAFEPGDHGSTFGGNPLACAAAVAVLETVQREALVENAKRMGEYFKEKLDALKEKHSIIKEVRGIGLMIGVEMDGAAAKTVHGALFGKRIIAGLTGATLRILPPLIVTREDIDMFCDGLDTVLSEL